MNVQINKDVGEKLVEKIADAVEIIYDPRGVKKASREFNGELFQKICNDENLSYEERYALIEELSTLSKKKRHRDKIVLEAMPLLTPTAKPEFIDDSWMLNFWDKAGTVSDETFQKLWSKILAAEANEPNTVTKRLLHNLSLMSPIDANNFTILSKFCFIDKYDNSVVHPIIYMKEHQDFYTSQGLYSHMLNDLEQFSLIETNYDSGFMFNNKKTLSYLRNTLEVKAERIPIGNVRLTSDGQKLFSIVKNYQREKILDYTIEILQYKGCVTKLYNGMNVDNRNSYII